MGVYYCTREDVKAALDYKETARNNAQIDRLIEAASRRIETMCHRRFYPEIDTRYFDWPNKTSYRSWRLWLDADELISVTSISSAGTSIPSTDYFLEPVNAGPPYTRVDLDLSSNSTFGGGATWQRDITITGVFGHSAEETTAGTLAENLDSSETGVDVSDSAAIGVGSLIKIDDERMQVTGKTMLTTGQTTQGALTASQADVTVAVTTGSSYIVGETILVDFERMLVVDIAGNNLIVKRAWDGSVLAGHSGSATIYAPRTLTVTRGVLGTTAATHSTSTAIAKHVVPGPVTELAIAEVQTILQQEESAYARSVGSGESMFASGRGLSGLRTQVVGSHGRKMRRRTA